MTSTESEGVQAQMDACGEGGDQLHVDVYTEN